MTTNRMMLFFAAVVSIAVLTQACSEKNDTTDNVDPQANTEPETPDKSPNKPPANKSTTTIKSAMLSIGAKCDAPKRGQRGCTWQGVSYTMTETTDWKRQNTRFRAGCDSGQISADYTVVSDGLSWIVRAASGADETARLYAALSKQSGLNPPPRLVRFCDL